MLTGFNKNITVDYLNNYLSNRIKDLIKNTSN